MVCANDETALGLMIVALGRGFRVPDDLAITGFDDMPMASLVQPGLTTVRQPVRELATTTARLLADRSPEPAGEYRPRHRSSSCADRAGADGGGG